MKVDNIRRNSEESEDDAECSGVGERNLRSENLGTDSEEKHARELSGARDLTETDKKVSDEQEGAGHLSGNKDSRAGALKRPKINRSGTPSSSTDSGSLRKIYMGSLSNQDVGVRIKEARCAAGDIHAAYCFDPDARVIRAVLENRNLGLLHGRLIAANHRTAGGLDYLGLIAAFVRDKQVQRMLLRNPQLSRSLFDKITNSLRMNEVYRLTLSHEVTDRSKARARDAFRDKFRTGSPEEKVSVIFETEGRCLTMLMGVPLDGRTTAILAGRPINSVFMIHSFARWPATPPSILANIAKQAMVRRNPNLRTMISRHPNAPATIKNKPGRKI